MKLKSILIKFLLITVFVAGTFALSSCFTGGLIMLGCISCNNGCDDNSGSGEAETVEYSLEEDGTSYYVSSIPHTVSEAVILSEYRGKPVTRISSYAFNEYISYGCGGEYTSVYLSRLVVPASIKSVTGQVGYYDSTIYEVKYLGTLEEWCEIEGGSNLFTGNTRLMIDGALVTSFEAPESMTKVPCDLFNGYTYLSEVTLHNGVTEIGERAFMGTRVKTLSLPDNEALGLGVGAFESCRYLESVTLPKGVKIIPEFAFAECISLAKVEVEGVIEELGASCFNGCEKLSSIDLASAVIAAIPEYAFGECSSLCSFVIPQTVIRIDSSAFSGCRIYEFYNLSQITRLAYIGGNGVGGEELVVHTDLSEPSAVAVIGDYSFITVETPVLCVYSGGDRELTLPDGVSGAEYTLADGLFEGRYITSVYIPDKVVGIGEKTFADCNSLAAVTGCDGVKNVGVRAFSGCSSLKAINLYGATKIGAYAFEECKSLSSFNSGTALTTVGIKAFINTSSLESVELIAETVDDNAFEGSGLVYADLSVETIEGYAFKNCVYLSEVVLREGLVTLQTDAFRNCASIKRLDFPSTMGTLGSQTGLKSLESVSVHENNARYKCIDGCVVETDTKTIVLACKNAVIPTDESVEGIGSCAFESVDIDTLVIPANIKKIGWSAFRNSTLRSVTITGVETINTYAFLECKNLERVEFSDNLVSIYSHAFERCESLTEITLPDSVKSVGEGAFVRCGNLKVVYLPSGAKVHGGAFDEGTQIIYK